MSDTSAALVTFDVTKQALNGDGIVNLFNSVPQILDWWNYIPGVFIVKHFGSSIDITTNLYDAGLRSYLLVPIDPADVQGQLPPSSWNKLFKDMFVDDFDRVLAKHVERRTYREKSQARPSDD
ncbi:hypothetical protein GGR44_000620 [Sphingobium fontiphilum]|uniref:Uncharacterized protein n=1 Tax=Sphingobium fontiphilum TaxID=944425 RepID=A0A7W6GPG2_9SPHN|nr:hypothetical protein [Sphingobium fontiphilum]MBB3980989.1 hypothetical protein [Sphingobium fontiphilum]